jgi:hypothetical protein
MGFVWYTTPKQYYLFVVVFTDMFNHFIFLVMPLALGQLAVHLQEDLKHR